MEKDLQVYVHIPFCAKKCKYCDFLSSPQPEDVTETYFTRLKEEIRGFDNREGREVSSVFFGGGTPSLPDADYLTGILDTLREKFTFRPDAEISIECNPGTLEDKDDGPARKMGKLERYHEAGFNRLSMGLQSADNTLLRRLGRIHSWEQFEREYRCARRAGFSNINVDLMYGLPGQSPECWSDTLDKVLSLPNEGPDGDRSSRRGPEHISAYSLIIEEGTEFWELYHEDEQLRRLGEKPLFLPTEEEEDRMLAILKEKTEKAGMRRYEISNYALEGFACRHNSGYWLRRDYAGFGLGASSLLNGCRFHNTADLKRYLSGDLTKEELTPLSLKNEIEETFFLGLRMMKGVDLEAFEKRYRKDPYEIYGEQIGLFVRQGLLEEKDGRIFLTERGIDVSNLVMAEFLLDDLPG